MVPRSITCFALTTLIVGTTACAADSNSTVPTANLPDTTALAPSWGLVDLPTPSPTDLTDQFHAAGALQIVPLRLGTLSLLRVTIANPLGFAVDQLKIIIIDNPTTRALNPSGVLRDGPWMRVFWEGLPPHLGPGETQTLVLLFASPRPPAISRVRVWGVANA